MKVLIINKATFQTGVYSDVSNIAYTSGNYVLTYNNGATYTVSSTQYYISVLWG